MMNKNVRPSLFSAPSALPLTMLPSGVLYCAWPASLLSLIAILTSMLLSWWMVRKLGNFQLHAGARGAIGIAIAGPTKIRKLAAPIAVAALHMIFDADFDIPVSRFRCGVVNS